MRSQGIKHQWPVAVTSPSRTDFSSFVDSPRLPHSHPQEPYSQINYRSQARASGPSIKRMRGGGERARKWGHGERGYSKDE